MSGLLKRIIPCLDVDNGRVVKGINFVNLKDMGDPVELAMQYEQQGADEIVFLDITATSDNRQTALDNVKKVAANLSIPFTLGGGLRTLDDISAFLDAGADKVALNSIALLQPEIINQAAQKYGSQCIVVAVDSHLDVEGNYSVYASGGRQKTDRLLRPWAYEVAERGAGEILLTCMHKDGTGEGFDNQITGELAKQLPIQVIASGGAKNPADLLAAFESGADAVLAASMFHSGNYSISETKQFLNKKGVAVRLD
ncbi:MAG TPA: imidazole glycerol phosphate synthase subunit HisF [Aeromonadales bacterium]|nr:imidazole glycerol phosphate synthase subunit HisF [Aeromonadales bacterium]